MLFRAQLRVRSAMCLCGALALIPPHPPALRGGVWGFAPRPLHAFACVSFADTQRNLIKQKTLCVFCSLSCMREARQWARSA